MLSDMHLWSTIRHALFVENISKRAACKRFGLSFRTIQKVAAVAQPGKYQRRLRDEHGYTGSYRTVCLTVAQLREKAKTL